MIQTNHTLKASPRFRMLTEDQVKVTFADVAGVEEAKEETKLHHLEGK